jgi:hypothetical protein
MTNQESNPELRDAIRFFWRAREKQSKRQNEDDRDRGSRSAVTGGKQMDGFIHLARTLLIKAKVPESCIFIDKLIELPGWYRAEKKWDLVIVHERELIAAIEFKSQIGPSFGNNFNNRTEEAIGSATDIWAAYREGAFRPSSRPFLGYLMLLEDCNQSNTPVKTACPHFQVFQEFVHASYRDRYAILIEKLLRDRLYDGACFLLSDAASSESGNYTEPNSELTFARFITPLIARVKSIWTQ